MLSPYRPPKLLQIQAASYICRRLLPGLRPWYVRCRIILCFLRSSYLCFSQKNGKNSLRLTPRYAPLFPFRNLLSGSYLFPRLPYILPVLPRAGAVHIAPTGSRTGTPFLLLFVARSDSVRSPSYIPPPDSPCCKCIPFLQARQNLSLTEKNSFFSGYGSSLRDEDRSSPGGYAPDIHRKFFSQLHIPGARLL